MTGHWTMDSILSMIAAPFAALFLVLALFVYAFRIPTHGVRLYVLQEPEYTTCEPGRVIVVNSTSDGHWFINMEPDDPKKLPGRISEIMQYRYERALYFQPDQNTSMQDVIQIASGIQAAVPDLRIGMATHRQLLQVIQTPWGPRQADLLCMQWPASVFQHEH
jgi:biopolymer transport protein ExbD